MLRPNLNREEQLQDYFALCLACHHATVATFVPTDVDTKIRGVSGHNGEHWSAIAAGLGRLLELRDTVAAEEAQPPSKRRSIANRRSSMKSLLNETPNSTCYASP
jgi:hypothetical protein